MALTFVNNSEVSIAADTSIDNLDPYTIMAWCYPTAFSVGDRIASKHGSINRIFRITSGGGLMLERMRATSNLTYESDGAVLTANTWNFVASRLDTASGGNQGALFIGDRSTLAVEPTYGTANDGSGAIDSDASTALTVGNVGAGSPNFQGSIAFFAVYAEALSDAQIHVMQFRPMVTSTCRVYMHLGINGTGTQYDWSGNANNGTVAGSPTVGAHVPLPIMFPHRSMVFVPAAAGTQTITPDPVAITLAVPDPTVQPGTLTLSPNPVAVTLAVPDPAVQPGTLTVSPDAVAVTLAVADPNVQAGTTNIAPDPVAVTLTAPDPAVQLGALTVSPDPVTVTLAVPDPAIQPGSITLSPDAVAVALTVPDPTVQPGAITVSPDAVAVTLAVPDPTVQAGALTVSPDPVAVTIAVPAPSISGISALLSMYRSTRRGVRSRVRGRVK